MFTYKVTEVTYMAKPVSATVPRNERRKNCRTDNCDDEVMMKWKRKRLKDKASHTCVAACASDLETKETSHFFFSFFFFGTITQATFFTSSSKVHLITGAQ